MHVIEVGLRNNTSNANINLDLLIDRLFNIKFFAMFDGTNSALQEIVIKVEANF